MPTADISQMPYLCLTIQTSSPTQPRVVWYREYELEGPDDPFSAEPWVDVVLELERLKVDRPMTAIDRARKDMERYGLSLAHVSPYVVVLEHPHHTNYRNRWEGLQGRLRKLEGVGQTISAEPIAKQAEVLRTPLVLGPER